jgi:hypothetical protein
MRLHPKVQKRQLELGSMLTYTRQLAHNREKR